MRRSVAHDRRTFARGDRRVGRERTSAGISGEIEQTASSASSLSLRTDSTITSFHERVKIQSHQLQRSSRNDAAESLFFSNT